MSGRARPRRACGSLFVFFAVAGVAAFRRRACRDPRHQAGVPGVASRRCRRRRRRACHWARCYRRQACCRRRRARCRGLRRQACRRSCRRACRRDIAAGHTTLPNAHNFDMYEREYLIKVDFALDDYNTEGPTPHFPLVASPWRERGRHTCAPRRRAAPPPLSASRRAARALRRCRPARRRRRPRSASRRAARSARA